MKPTLHYTDGIAQKALIEYLIVKNDYNHIGEIALLENLITYACQNLSKEEDAVPLFLCDIVPDLELYEAAAFMTDDLLSPYAREEAARFWKLHALLSRNYIKT